MARVPVRVIELLNDAGLVSNLTYLPFYKRFSLNPRQKVPRECAEYEVEAARSRPLPVGKSRLVKGIDEILERPSHVKKLHAEFSSELNDCHVRLFFSRSTVIGQFLDGLKLITRRSGLTIARNSIRLWIFNSRLVSD